MGQERFPERIALLLAVTMLTPAPLPALADTIVDNGEVLNFSPGVSSFSDALVIGKVGAGTANIGGGAGVVMNTTDGSTASRIEIGNGAGSNGTLNVNGGTLTVNIAAGGVAPTSIGRVWVGGGLTNTTGGTGTLNMSSGLIDFVPVTAGTGNYGGLAVGRGVGVVGAINQTGGIIRADSILAVDVGTVGGTGTYDLHNGAVFDGSHGGVTMFIGSRAGSGGQLSTGTLTIHDNAKFTMTTGPISGGQLYVGDGGSTGTIRQTGAGSTVTLGLTNPVLFGSNINSVSQGGGTGTYRLEAGTLNILNSGGSAQTIFGANTGGSGTFAISGGAANVATNIVLGSVGGSTGLIDQTGGTLSLTGGARLLFGSGSGTYDLKGGTLAIGGTNAISGTGTLNLGNATLRVQGSTLTTSNAATLLAGTHFTLDTNGLGATWSGVLAGDGGLTKSGAGTLTLSAANTYRGSTTIAGGTLALTNANGLNVNSAVGMATGTTLDLTALAAAATVNIGALSGSGTVRLGDSYLVSTVGAGQSSSFSGTLISDAWGYESNYGRFIKAGAGDLVINGSTMDKGEGYVVAGSMTQSTGTTAWSNLNVGSGTGATGTLNVSGGSLTLNVGLRVGDFGGTGAVQQTGGTVRLQQSCGDLNRCPAFNLGNQGGTGTYTISGGALLLEGGSHSIGRNSGTSAASSGTLNISGTGLVQLGPSDSNGVLVIGDRDPGSAPNSTGIVNQTGGTLRILGGSEFYLGGYGSGTYNLSGGALEIGGTSLRGNFPGGVTPYTFNLGGGTVRAIGTALNTSVRATLVSGTSSTIDTNGIGATWSGVLSGDGALTKAGAGTLTLTGANTYTGGTTVSGGILRGNVTSLQGHITNNATVVFDQATAGTYAGDMTGSGTLTKLGAGALTLSGNNSYSGGTVVSAGSLRGTTTNLQGDIANNAAVVFDQATAGTYAGNMSGTGSLTKLGAGTLTLSGSNSHAGGTTVSAGALQGNATSLQGAITNNAAVIFDQAGVGLYAGSMSGSGNLTKLGAGTLIMSGNNSYGGGTTVSAGALQGNTASLQGAITNNASVVFAQASAGTYAGNMTGSGSLTKLGAGTLILAGTNNYAGGTTVSAGALQGNTTSLQGAITNNASVVFDQATAGTYAGDMTGSGSLTKLGTGTLTLSGINNYAGGTTVSAGILRLGSATALPTIGALTVNGGEIDLNGNNLTVSALAGAGGRISLGSANLTASTAGDTTLSAAITGTGGITKSGGGTLILSGANTYTGPTSVSGGRLSVNGSITSDVTVGAGGNLGGSGTITGAVSNAGVLAPGNSIGTLTVSGSFTQAAGSSYQVEANAAGQADRTNVTGAPGRAIINGGVVQALAAPGVYAPSTTYTIVNATGGVSGTYASVSSNYPFLQASLSYDPNNVYLTLKPGGFAAGSTTANQAAVGAALDQSVAAASGDFATVVGTLATTSLAQGQAVMNAISGQNYSGFSSAVVGAGQLFMSALSQQLDAARGGDPRGGMRVALAEACEIEVCAPGAWSLWATGLAGFGSIAGNANAGTVTYSAGGAAAGLDYRIDPRLLLGIGVGFSSGSQWVSGFSGRGSTDSYQATLYGSFADGAFWASALAGYAYNDNRMTRQIVIPGLQARTATGGTGANQLLGQIEAGYRLGLFAPAAATLAPFARLQGTTVMQNGFIESGASSLNLSVAPQTTNSLRSTLGAELAGRIGTERPVGLLFSLGWMHEYADTARPVTASFAGAPGSNFTVLGAPPARDAAALALAANTAIAKSTSVYFRYDGEIGGGSDAHALTAGFRMSW